MILHPRLVVLYGQAGWMLLVVNGLLVLDLLTLDLFLMLSLGGLVFVAELTSPASRAAPWRRRLRVVILAGLLLTGIVVGERLYVELLEVFST